MSKKMTTNQYLKPVLDWLEAGAPETYVDDVRLRRFGMEFYQYYDPHTCGTVCCIAGAVALFNNFPPSWHNSVTSCYRTGRRIGLDRPTIESMFFRYGVTSEKLEVTTPSEAAAMLRRFMNTGEVVW